MSTDVTSVEDLQDSSIHPETLENNYMQIVFDANSVDYDISSDIRNADGLLLARAGKKVDKAVYDKLLQHKLLRPLDDCMQLHNQVTPEALLEDIGELCGNVLVGKVGSFDETLAVIRNIIKAIKFDNIITNKLTLFKSQRLEKFDHALATAFLGVDIAMALGHNEEQLVDIFSACLFHDIGEIFTDQKLLHKGEFSEEEFKAIKVHPVVSYVLLKESSTSFNDAVLNGVLNHHERLDGSGYPRALHGEQLGLVERIVAIVDTFEAIRRKGRSVDDAVWAIRAQSALFSITGESILPAYDPDVASVLFSTIHDESPDESPENTSRLKAYLAALELHVGKIFDRLNAVVESAVVLSQKINDYLQNISDESSREESGCLRQVASDLHVLLSGILESSGLTHLDQADIPRNRVELNATRKDIERIVPAIFGQLAKASSALQTADFCRDESSWQELVELGESARTTAHGLCRLVQESFESPVSD